MRIVVLFGEDVFAGHSHVGYIDDDVNVDQIIDYLNRGYGLNLVIDDYMKTEPGCYNLKNLGHTKCNAYITRVSKINL